MSSPPLILLIEDDDAHAELIEACLQSNALETRLYRLGDGQEAIDYLTATANSNSQLQMPALIVQDLRLPKLDGLEVVRFTRSQAAFAITPVVVLTTSRAPEDVRAAYQAGANSFLVKPLAFDELKHMLQQMLDYWVGWNCA